MKHTFMRVIKPISTVLMMSAIGLELWHLGATLAQISIPEFFYPIFWVERVALFIHGVEGIIAAFYARQKQKAAIRYGIYTFFVGTVGLVELFAVDKAAIEPDPFLLTQNK